MVNERIKIRDKWRTFKKVIIVLIVVVAIALVLSGMFFLGFFVKKPTTNIVIENPLKNIVFANTNEVGVVNKEAVVEQGIIEFDVDYINYLLVAIGVGNLHKSMIGYGNPKIEFVLGDEVWSTEITKNGFNTGQISIDDPDLRISMSKEEAVEALLATDAVEFMKASVYSGETGVERIAGNVELGSKGYLAMYNELTGEEIEE